MDILLDRSLVKLKDGEEKELFEVSLSGVVLSRFETFPHAYGKARALAKKHRKKLFISKACVSDWYVGFPHDKTQKPKIFERPDWQLTAADQTSYRFVEGPFESPDDAKQAAYRICGKAGTLD
jgi:hypothetical protein